MRLWLIALAGCTGLGSNVLKPRPPACDDNPPVPCETLSGFVGVNAGVAVSGNETSEARPTREWLGELFVSRQTLALGLRAFSTTLIRAGQREPERYSALGGLLLAYVAPVPSLNLFAGLGASTGTFTTDDWFREAQAWRGVVGMRHGVQPFGQTWWVANLELGWTSGDDTIGNSFSFATLMAGLYVSL